MKIVSISIVAFGKLNDFQMEFDKGVNVLQQQNGYGKSTISAFIRAMLFGLGYNYKKIDGVSVNDVTRFMPWNTTSKFGGSMVVEHQGKTYRIERFFGTTAKQESLIVLCVDTGKQLAVDNAGEYFLGLTVESYDRSTYYPQESVEVSSNDNFDQRLANFVQDSTVDYDTVQSKIRAYKKNLQLEKGKGGVIYQLEQQRDELEKQLNQCKAEQELRHQRESQLQQSNQTLQVAERQIDQQSKTVEQLKTQLYQCKPSQAEMEQIKKIEEIDLQIKAVPPQIEEDRKQILQLKEQIDQMESLRKTTSPKTKFALSFSVALVAVVATLLAFSQLVWAGCVGVVAVVLWFVLQGKFPANPTAEQVFQLKKQLQNLACSYVVAQTEDISQIVGEFLAYYNDYQTLLRVRSALGEKPQIAQSNQFALQQQLDNAQKDLANAMARREQLIKDIQTLTVLLQQPITSAVEIAEKLEETQRLLQQAKHSYQIATKTSEILSLAKDSLSSAYLPQLCSSCEQLLNSVTLGNYKVTSTRDFSISLTENGVTKQLGSFSRGIKEIAMLCFRVALSQMLYDGNVPFLIIDDAFVNFDEQNFARATQLIKQLSTRTQVIYFTCHNRIGNF